MSPAAALVAALALVFPSSSALLRLDAADVVARSAATHGVPAQVLSGVCWLESRMGTAPRYASLCGVRVHHVYVSRDALPADIAARSLARRRAECGGWLRALAAYRTGGGCLAADGGYGGRVLAVARRLGWRP